MAQSAYVLLCALLASGVTARPEIDTRIVGGQPAHDREFPWAVALYLNMTGSNQYSLCSGTLISPSYVLTAAHCVTVAQEIRLVLGNAALNETGAYEIRLTVDSSHFIIPEDYREGTYDWDIALIRIPGPLDVNDYVKPVDLAEGNYTYAGDIGVVTGWGITSHGQTTIEQRLRYVKNIVLSNAACLLHYPLYSSMLLSSHLCLATLALRSACVGDSGGALVVNGEAIGIVSVGPGDCFREYPVVFTRISSYRTWIRDASGV